MQRAMCLAGCGSPEPRTTHQDARFGIRRCTNRRPRLDAARAAPCARRCLVLWLHGRREFRRGRDDGARLSSRCHAGSESEAQGGDSRRRDSRGLLRTRSSSDSGARRHRIAPTLGRACIIIIITITIGSTATPGANGQRWRRPPAIAVAAAATPTAAVSAAVGFHRPGSRSAGAHGRPVAG